MADIHFLLPESGLTITGEHFLPIRHTLLGTGTLDQVSAVAGYVTAKSGRQYTVVGMLNHEQADRGPGVELMDALLAWVFEQ